MIEILGRRIRSRLGRSIRRIGMRRALMGEGVEGVRVPEGLGVYGCWGFGWSA